MLRHVDLCSGIGGFALGFEWAGLSKPVLFCDVDPFCIEVLRKHWPDVPKANDVKELANEPEVLVPDCDILTAGYPCQPFSLAGQRKGTEDDRHIWPHILRIVAQKRPTWCVFENVYGHISMGLDEVLADLEAESYATRTFIVPACGVNAPHKRERLWIVAKNVGDTSGCGLSGIDGWGSGQESEDRCADVADTTGIRVQGLRPGGEQEPHSHGEEEVSVRGSEDMADTDSQRAPRWSTGREDAGDAGQSSRGKGQYSRGMETWDFEPNVGRVANGIPRRVDRLKSLGNAVVPHIVEQLGLAIKAVHEE
jgi:DNA (cytosine-5)-methyltransferase 1